jgi:hypothetical protein
VHHEFNPSVKFFGEAGFPMRVQQVDTPGGTANPGPGPAVIISSYSPSDTFRASTRRACLLYARSVAYAPG